MKKSPFDYFERVTFDPAFVDEADLVSHPLSRGTVVYWLGMIENVSGHAVVVKPGGMLVMVYPGDLRKIPKEESWSSDTE